MALTDEGRQILDLNIDGIKKTAFRINGDDNAILELNLSDMYIGKRLKEGYDQFEKEIEKITALSEDDDDFYKKLEQADKKMRETLDFIFDAPVSELCGKGGTMYDIQNGMFRFESITDSITKLYEDNLNAEFKKMKSRVQKRVDKYVPQDHNKKSTKSQKRG